jgi:hypothetical protein
MPGAVSSLLASLPDDLPGLAEERQEFPPAPAIVCEEFPDFARTCNVLPIRAPAALQPFRRSRSGTQAAQSLASKASRSHRVEIASLRAIRRVSARPARDGSPAGGPENSDDSRFNYRPIGGLIDRRQSLINRGFPPAKGVQLVQPPGRTVDLRSEWRAA